MIFVLLTRPHAYTVQHYLETWGRDARGMVTTLFYEDLAFGGRLRPGTYIFSDLERLSDAQLELANLAWRIMAARPTAAMQRDEKMKGIMPPTNRPASTGAL